MKIIKTNTLNKLEIDGVKNEQVSIETFLDLPPVPMQRNTEERAKQSKVKKMLKTLKLPHIEVALVELKNNCKYYGATYKKGTRYIVNGNTRKLFWLNNLSDKVPSYVNATVYEVQDMEEVRDIYNMYDNPDTMERNQEKVRGIISGLYGYEPKSTKVNKGEIVTALHYACNKLNPIRWNTASINAQDLPFEVKEYIEEIKSFDKLCVTPSRWDQALVCAALMSLKRYGTDNPKLLECLSRIDSNKINNIGNDYDGVSHINIEWMNHKKFPSKGTSWSKPSGFCETVPFTLYWIEKYMLDEKGKQLGFNWKDTHDTWFKHHSTTTIFDIEKSNA